MKQFTISYLLLCKYKYNIYGILNPLAVIEYVQLWGLLQGIELSDEPNRLTWKWTTNGSYTA